MASLEAGHVHRNLVVSPADLAGCSPVHSAYIPGLATSGGFWRHTAAQPFSRGRIVFPGQYGFSLVVKRRPQQDSNLRSRLRSPKPKKNWTCTDLPVYVFSGRNRGPGPDRGKARGPLAARQLSAGLEPWQPVAGDRASRSARRPGDPQPVTVRVTKFELAPVRGFAVRPAELGHDRVDIAHVQTDQGVGPGIAPVLGQEQPRPATCDRHERRAAGIEAISHCLVKPKRSYHLTAASASATRRIGTASTSMRA